MSPLSRKTSFIVVATVAPVAVAAALVPLRDRTVNVNLALVLVLVVLAAGALAGRLGGLLAAASAALSYDVLLTRPYGSLRINESQDVVTTVLLATVGMTAAILVERVRRHAARAASTQRALDRLERVTELISGADTRQRQLRLACEELTTLLDLKACRYQRGPSAPTDVHLEHGTVRVPGAPSFASLGRVVLPVRHGGREVGHFVLVFPRTSMGLDVPAQTRRAAAVVADAVGNSFGSVKDTV
jgi:K+-sensing histidine kinase KdpD